MGIIPLMICYVAEQIAFKHGAQIKSVPWTELVAKIESGDLLHVQYHSTLEKWIEHLEIVRS